MRIPNFFHKRGRQSERLPLLISEPLELLIPEMKNENSKIKNILKAVAVLSILCLPGITGANGQTNIIIDFEGFTVGSGAYVDPTTVPGSGWTRDGTGASDWDVHCCSGSLDYNNPGLEEDTFDGSSNFLVLRRSNPNAPARSDENTEFTFPALVDGSLRFQVNPQNGSADPFRLELRDSVSGRTAVQIVYTESRWSAPGGGFKVNSADFRVFDFPGNLILSEIQLDGYTNSFDRWYEIFFTMHAGGTFDLEITDIGPTTPNSVTGSVGARGVLGSVTNLDAGVLGIDTFRIARNSGLGGGGKPSMLDNITITRSAGSVVASAELGTGFEIPYPTLALTQDPMSIYQPQVTADLALGIWTAHGPPILGDGSTKSALLPTLGSASRAYRIVVY